LGVPAALAGIKASKVPKGRRNICPAKKRLENQNDKRYFSLLEQ
jgi:hypothetical protein